MTPIDGPPCPGPGFRLVDRIGALVKPEQAHRVKWRWCLDWWDRYPSRRFSPWGRRTRRRGVPVS